MYQARLYKSFIPLIGIIFLIASQASAFDRQIGERLLDVELPVPEEKAHLSYLGLDGLGMAGNEKKFRVSQIKTKVVLVEIFSMYCPHCQKDAPNMNFLLRMIQQNEKYKNKIKIIGIGAGNSDFEVNFFRKNYSVEFPLFSDGDFSIHKRLGEVRTPYFIGVKIHQNARAEIFMSEPGGGKAPGEFLDLIVQKSDL